MRKAKRTENLSDEAAVSVMDHDKINQTIRILQGAYDESTYFERTTLRRVNT